MRFSNVKWHFVASPQLFDLLHTTPLKLIPPASRHAILRWAIDSDPDFHFRLRPHLTRHTPCRCGCGHLSSLYPEGLSRGSVSASHLSAHLTWTLFLPSNRVSYAAAVITPSNIGSIFAWRGPYSCAPLGKLRVGSFNSPSLPLA